MAQSHSPNWMACTAPWIATREEEQAVLYVTEGPDMLKK